MSPLAVLLDAPLGDIFVALLIFAALSCPAGLVYANHLHQRGRIVAAARIAERSAWGTYAFVLAGSVFWALVATGVLGVSVKARG